MDLIELMKYFGEKGHHVLVRYDPEREQNNFTVLIGHIRLADTDDPEYELEEALVTKGLYYKIRVLKGPDKGEEFIVVEEDKKGNVYYSDGFGRWTIGVKEEEGDFWRKVGINE